MRQGLGDLYDPIQEEVLQRFDPDLPTWVLFRLQDRHFYVSLNEPLLQRSDSRDAVLLSLRQRYA